MHYLIEDLNAAIFCLIVAVSATDGTADAKKKRFAPEHRKMAEHLKDKILEHKPDAKIPTLLESVGKYHSPDG